MKTTYFVLSALLAGCASSPSKMTSSEARENLQNTWNEKIGVATQSDFVEKYGTANWCRSKEPSGETCRFYRKVATKWIGEEGRDKKATETFDEIVAEFDGRGKLRSFEVNAQR